MIKHSERIKLDISKITIDSSLGLLAYGDIAFTAWRKLKIENRKEEDEGK